jgi:competence protein ComGC
MKLKTTNRRSVQALTLPEVTIIAGVIFILFMVFGPGLIRARQKAARISCVSNLKGVTISFRIWANDSNGLYPMNTEFKDPTLRVDAFEGRMFRVFQIMSNELSSPITLVCPADNQVAAPDWASLANVNLSFFIGLDAMESRPNMLLTGDRNLMRDGQLLSGVVSLGTNLPVAWTAGTHRSSGNIGMSDGSVHQVTTHLLRAQLAHSGDTTNRVVFPQ